MIHVLVKPESKKNTIVEVKPDYLEVTLTAKPEHNEANKLLTLALAEYYNVPVNRIQIITGHKSRHKTIEIR